MRALTIFIVLVLAGTQISCGSAEEQKAGVDPGPEAERREALAVAQQFLALVDAGTIDQTYPLVASFLKARTDGPAWEATVAGLRDPAGKVLSRELGSVAYMGEVTELPPGNYFVIQYKALYSARLWFEKVVVSQEDDGWRIAGYFLTRMM